jgi:hypothetical protein
LLDLFARGAFRACISTHRQVQDVDVAAQGVELKQAARCVFPCEMVLR